VRNCPWPGGWRRAAHLYTKSTANLVRITLGVVLCFTKSFFFFLLLHFFCVDLKKVFFFYFQIVSGNFQNLITTHITYVRKNKRKHNKHFTLPNKQMR
jgi:hypothetical protein